MADNFLDDVLNGDEEDTTLGVEGSREPDDGGSDKGGSGDSGTVARKRYDDLQEKMRQQAEELKEIKQQNANFGDFISKLRGTDEATQKLADEAKMRREWTEDTPGKVLELVNKQGEEMKDEIARFRQETQLNEVFKQVEAEYGQSIKKLTPKLVPIVKEFSSDAKRTNPKLVLERALKIAGIEKPTDMPNAIEGGGSSRSISSKQVQAEADQILKRLQSAANKKKATSFF